MQEELLSTNDKGIGRLSENRGSPAVPLVCGSPFTEIPEDLYIPPDALEVILETFEGPLDLLLYLIKRQKFDILDIPVASITAQYVSYIEMMQEMRIEIAAEYLVMAAVLAEIKSQLLLPRPKLSEADELLDPRAELLRRLQEYERFKDAAERIDNLPREGRDIFVSQVCTDSVEIVKTQPQVDLRAVVLAFQDVLQRTQQLAHHHVYREPLSVRERMSAILQQLDPSDFLAFERLFLISEGRQGVVVSFLAILELCKEGLIEITQVEPFADLKVKTL